MLLLLPSLPLTELKLEMVKLSSELVTIDGLHLVTLLLTLSLLNQSLSLVLPRWMSTLIMKLPFLPMLGFQIQTLVHKNLVLFLPLQLSLVYQKV